MAINKVLWGSLMLVIWLALLVSASASAQPSAGNTSRAILERQDIRAQLKPRRFTTLAAEIGAKVQVLSFKDGESFKQGQLLIQFDCSVQQAHLNKAQAELESAQHIFQSNQRLFELNSVGQLDLDLSRVEVSKAQADVGAHRAVLNKCRVLAPFNGRIAEQRVREQQFVQPGQPLLDILDDSQLELEFLLPSVWLRWIKLGMPFEVQIDETRKTYPVRFTRIGARIDPVSQSIRVSAAIEGQFPELISGMSGRVLLTPPKE